MILHRGIAILGIVAILSVALNLFLAGNLLGHEFRGPPPPFILEERFDTMLQQLPDKDQPIVRRIIEEHRDELLTKWHALKPINREIGEAVRADPFSPDQVRDAFRKSDQQLAAFRAAIQDVAIEIASKISPEGRKKLHVPGAGF